MLTVIPSQMLTGIPVTEVGSTLTVIPGYVTEAGSTLTVIPGHVTEVD